jgi:hypothetical protein
MPIGEEKRGDLAIKRRDFIGEEEELSQQARPSRTDCPRAFFSLQRRKAGTYYRTLNPESGKEVYGRYRVRVAVGVSKILAAMARCWFCSSEAILSARDRSGGDVFNSRWSRKQLNNDAKPHTTWRRGFHPSWASHR